MGSNGVLSMLSLLPRGLDTAVFCVWQGKHIGVPKVGNVYHDCPNLVTTLPEHLFIAEGRYLPIDQSIFHAKCLYLILPIY